MNLRDTIRTIPDYPKPGIMFRDITTLLGHGEAFSHAMDQLVALHQDEKIDQIAGIEARGFIIGGALAHRLKLGFVPVRKKGKLPWNTIAHEYALEYGTDTVEVHEDAVEKGARVLIVDDLLATGGTAQAAIALVERLGGEVTGCSFVIDLPDLGGRKRLEETGLKVNALVAFEGE